MGNIYDFMDNHEADETMRKTWAEFRNSLATGKFKFDQPHLALKDTFMKVFNDIFQENNIKEFFTISLEQMIASGTRFCRGARLQCTDKVTYDRFVPQKEYINEDNRFSPKGYEWLYLAMQNSKECESDLYEPMEKCCICEIKIKEGETVGLCKFELNNRISNKLVVDLTIGEQYSFDTINKNLESYAQEHKKKLVSDILLSGKNVDVNSPEFIFEIKKWVAHTYAKIMSKQLFIPLETGDKELIYAPFQCLAQYFISQGFCGIIYNSTVCPGIKNMVLFDKSYAKPTGIIKTSIYHE